LINYLRLESSLPNHLDIFGNAYKFTA
jgi:hypothetical protein